MSSGTIDGAGERQTCKLCFDDIDILVQYLENTRVRCRTQDGTLTLYKYLNKLFPPGIGLIVCRDHQW